MIENGNRIDMDNFRFEMKILNLVFFKFESSIRIQNAKLP